jgi:hypothetical protein
MLRYLNIFMVLVIAVNIYLFWGTPAVYGWVAALGGWAPWAFTTIEKKNGNS